MSDKIVIRSLEDLAKIDHGRRMSLAEYGALLDGDIKDAEIEKLRAEVERLQKRDAEWTEKAAAWLSSAEAAQQLDGYRELAARVNELTLQRDAAVTLLAEWCHAVDGGAGWDYWDNHYKEARWGKGILRSLIDAEIAKLEPLEGEP